MYLHSELSKKFYCNLFLKHYGCFSDLLTYFTFPTKKSLKFFSHPPLLGQERSVFAFPPEIPGYPESKVGREVDWLVLTFFSRRECEGLGSSAGRSYIPSSFVCKIRLLQKRVCRLMAGSKLQHTARVRSACQV